MVYEKSKRGNKKSRNKKLRYQLSKARVYKKSKKRVSKKKTIKRKNGIRNIQVYDKSKLSGKQIGGMNGLKRCWNCVMRNTPDTEPVVDESVEVEDESVEVKPPARGPGSYNYEAWEAVAEKMTDLSHLHKLDSAKFRMYGEFASLAHGARMGTVEHNEYNLKAFARMLNIYMETADPKDMMPSVIEFRNRRFSCVKDGRIVIEEIR